MSREYKNYELQSINRPWNNKYLSSTVAILGADDKPYYCYISFSEKLVEKVGKVLPRGVSESDPAFLYVVESKNTKGVYYVYARYALGGLPPQLLWKTESQPTWLKFHTPKAENANSQAT